MQNIRVLIVEDELIVSEEIKELLTSKGFEVVGQCTSAEEALSVLNGSPADIALLDINIEGSTDGIDLAHSILKSHECAVIFLTAFADDNFFNRAKEVKPAAYIVKPFEERNLQMAIEVAFNNLVENGGSPKSEAYKMRDSIFIKESTRFKKIALEAIQYAEASGSYTDVITERGVTTLAINLKHFEGHLEAPYFMRVHRSYVVNLTKVDEYEGNRIFINNKTIPLSTSYKEEFLRKFTFI